MRVRIVDRLRAETEKPGGLAEADAFGFVENCSFERYREYLVRCFGFESPLESACVLTPVLASHGATSLPRTRYIAQDLVDLGFAPEHLLELRPCPMQPFRDLGRALGWLYVAERMVLTNRLCHRMLAGHAPDLAARASYLNCYGTETSARWQAFGFSLEQAAAQADPNRITAAAVESFEFLHHWLQAEPT
jgi:heme oxygenase